MLARVLLAQPTGGAWRHQQHERKLKMKTKLQVSKNVTMNKPDEKRQGMKVRTVVTGHDAKGRAVFVRDEQVDGTPMPGLGELAFLWNADEPATYPNAGNNPAAPAIFPPEGGIRYIIGTCWPPWLLSSSEPAAIRFRPAREVAIAMTNENRCSYRWKRLERESTRRRRGDTTGSGLAAEPGIGVQRVEAVPVAAQARDGS